MAAAHRRVAWPLVAAVGWALAQLSAACCPPTLPSGACATNADCPSGATCQDGVCRTPGSTSSGSTSRGRTTSGTSASSSSASSSAASSSGSSTPSGSSSSSGSTVSASSSSGGTSSSCTIGPGTPCSGDAECPTQCGVAQYCLLPLTVCPGFPNVDIIAGTGACHLDCRNGLCPCGSDADCPGGQCVSPNCVSSGITCGNGMCPPSCNSANLTQEDCTICLCQSCPPPPGTCNGPAAPCQSKQRACGQGGCCGDLGCDGVRCCIPPAGQPCLDGGLVPSLYTCQTDCDCPSCGGGFAPCVMIGPVGAGGTGGGGGSGGTSIGDAGTPTPGGTCGLWSPLSQGACQVPTGDGGSCLAPGSGPCVSGSQPDCCAPSSCGCTTGTTGVTTCSCG